MLLDTPVCNFGWKAPDFALPDPDGNLYTMNAHLGEKGLLIAFICNHCPYVQAIGHRLAQDTNDLMAEGVNVLAIMSNDYESVPSDSPKAMKETARQYGWKFPYLVDETQQVARLYDAVCTPDFFGLNRDGELQYRGRLDDARMQNETNRQRELVEAMRLIAKTGNGPEKQLPSMGCSIKWR